MWYFACLKHYDAELILQYCRLTKGTYTYFQLRPLSEFLTITNLYHDLCRIWSCLEPEFRLRWIRWVPFQVRDLVWNYFIWITWFYWFWTLIPPKKLLISLIVSVAFLLSPTLSSKFGKAGIRRKISSWRHINNSCCIYFPGWLTMLLVKEYFVK